MSDATPGPSFSRRLKELWATSHSAADFTITCDVRRFKVSREIVRLHSGYFANLFNSDWTANKDSLIDLKEDDVVAVYAMVDYFTHFDYGTYFDARSGYITVDEKRAQQARGSREDLGANLRLHAKVWAIADKYDVADLKLHACSSFERDGPALFADLPRVRGRRTEGPPDKMIAKDWFSAVEYIYEHSNPTEPGLRASVVRVWSAVRQEDKAQFAAKRWQHVMEKYPALGVDLAMGLGVGWKAEA